MQQVIPGILEKDWPSIEEKLNIVKTFTNTVHIDIIDGKFASNTTFLNPEPFKKYSNELFLELHMMVENPIMYLEPWANAGLKRFIGHVEQMPDQQAFVDKAKQYGEVGLAIDGLTPIDVIKVPITSLDSILVYTSSQVGFSGPKFLPERLEKVTMLKQKTDIPIEVDGGINEETITLAKNAGATRFVATSYLFGENNAEEKYNRLLSLV